ncbi:penicillin-binding protein 2 [Patulibacter sp. SYSU D01012]|uniref:peptidoglycan D,D-transpeptidase FtsI family protein n=1 Tax=Patulibacter sp. SYSU D01012 TaxID=2817381 RepID=UPI001B307C7B|nr:penicillin-binding protein 2 [Patulibacter sp. SYSU D01012]
MYADRRLRVLFTVAMVLVALAGLRSVWFALAKADTLSVRATGQQVTQRKVLALRGEIADRHGTPLAVSEPAADVAVSSKQVLELRTLKPPQQPAQMAQVIAESLGLDEDEVLKALTTGKSFEYLGRSVPETKIQAMKDRAKKLGIRLTGLSYEPRNRRSYPGGPLAGQLLGGYGNDDKALSGLEDALDDTLKGTYGEETLTNAGSGNTLRTRTDRPMVPGKDVSLTLDANIQKMTEDALGELGQTYRPKHATAIVMQPDGEILSMANWPRVDPNDPAGAPAEYRTNLATSLTYEPGSTFKAVAVAGALQDRVVTPETKFVVPPQMQVADRVIKDSHDHGVETLTPGGILAQSSNVGAIKIGMALNDKRGEGAFDGWMRNFGFGAKTGLGLWEEQGLLPKVADYSGSTMGNLPIGQGQLVTPLQIANAYATIANGGVIRHPTLLKTVGGRPAERAKGKRILRPQVAQELRGMLTGVFEPGGTASEVHVPGYTLAGKTGTSNVYDEKLGEYVENRNVASIAGFAPASNPKVIIVVVADEPAGGGYGATVAGPAFGKIARYAMQYLQVPTNK